MSFRCSKCGVLHLRFRYATGIKPASYCEACHAAFMRETRPTHSELSDEARRKANSRAYANTYQRRGHLVPEPCEKCGATAEKHHEDYARPLQVRWLCRTHHLAEHRRGTKPHVTL